MKTATKPVQNELLVQQSVPGETIVQPDPTSSLMRIIDRAANDPAFDVAKLEQLLAVQERWEANEARKAYVVAMARFKANPPVILKNKQVGFSTSKGLTEYKHATLDHVCDVVIASLSECGFSHRWENEQANGTIRVTCVLTHILGHSERTSLEASPDDSGGKNKIQAIGSAITYLERYTLLGATGLAAKGTDDDGRTADPFITPEELKQLHATLAEAGRDVDAFMRLHEVESLSEIPQSKFKEFMQSVQLMKATAKKKEATK